MTEPSDEQKAAAPAGEGGAGWRELLVMRRAGRAFAVYADEAEEVTKLRRAAPLPFAPPGVLGVTAVRGRMRTLIDPLPLLSSADAPTDETTSADAPCALVVALRGDEQLALAVERVERVVEIAPGALLPLDPPHDFARGRAAHDAAHVLVLDPARLFDALMHGHERRRVR